MFDLVQEFIFGGRFPKEVLHLVPVACVFDLQISHCNAQHRGGRLAAPVAKQLDLFLVADAARDVRNPADDSEDAEERYERGDGVAKPLERDDKHKKDGEEAEERGGQAGLARVAITKEGLDCRESTVV